MNSKRFYAIIIALFCGFFVGVLHAEEEETPKKKPDRYEVKDAQLWVKGQLNNAKKSTSILKKVKDEKSATKAVTALKKLLGSNEGEKTALGTVGAAKAPEGAAIDQVREKSAKQIEKASKDLATQIERIEALELDHPQLSDFITKLKELEY